MKKFLAMLSFCLPLFCADNKIILAPGMNEKLAADIRASVPNITLVTGRSPEAARQIENADAIIGGVSPEQFRQAHKLKWVHISSAGVEKGLFPELVRSDVVVTNAKNVYGPQIADHAFAFLLALTRRLNQTIPEQSKEEWPTGRGGMFELNGKTAVIIGVGGIGSQIAQRAHGFGMRVIGVDPRDIPISNEINRVVRPDELDSVLPEADVVFISAPHTPRSEGLMGPREFELLKKGSYFIAYPAARFTTPMRW